MRVRPALTLDVALKLALVGLLLFAVARPDLPQFHGKAMTGRAIGFPLAALVVPAAWLLVRRRRPRTVFPVAVDILVLLPFLIDTVGNAADLYDTITWWDDANHFANRAILELRTAYHDTLGDLALGLSGSVVAAAVLVAVRRRRRS